MLTVSKIFFTKIPLSNEISFCIGIPRGLILLYVVPMAIIYKRVSQISDRMYRTNFTPN